MSENITSSFIIPSQLHGLSESFRFAYTTRTMHIHEADDDDGDDYDGDNR